MKLKKQLLWGVVGIALIALAGNVQGANIRPIGDASSLSDLQGLFTSIGSTIDAVNDQTTEALFEPTGTGNAIASYIATVSWAAGDIDFGIYNMDDPNQQVSVFDYPSSSIGDSVVIQFDQGLDYVRVVDLTTLTVRSSTSYFKEFGFYLTAPSDTYFSEDDLNPNSIAHLLTYEGKDDQVTIGDSGTYSDIDHWYIAGEAWAIPGPDHLNADYSDMVVQMESITPIPEPASLVLFVGATSLIAFIRRRVIV